MSKFATLRGTSAAGRSYQDIALQAVEAARKPVDIDDFTRSRRKGVVLLASNETGHASATNANAALTNNEDDSSMATQENSSASSNPQHDQPDERALDEINQFIDNVEHIHREALRLREAVKVNALPEMRATLANLSLYTDGYWGKVVLSPRLDNCNALRDELEVIGGAR